MAKAIADIRSLARLHTDKALRVLVGIMNETKAPHASRVAAANSLLDRGWGKPPQDSTVTVIRGVNELTDSELAARIAEIRGTGASDGDGAAPLDTSQLN